MAAVTVPSVVRATLSGHVDETMRDSGIDMDIKNSGDAVDFCGILEHATVDVDDTAWESDSSDEISSIDEKAMSPFDTIGDDVADASMTESLLPSPAFLDDRVCVAANDGLPDMGSYVSLNSSTSSLASTMREDADADGPSGASPTPRRPSSAPPRSVLEPTVRPRDVSFEAYYDAPVYGYATAIQPAFPTVFDLFDHNDGITYYLGGGGRRVTRHQSQRGRGSGAFWPFTHPPLYACRLHHASTGRPPVVLYGGLDADRDGAWADAQFGRLSRSVKSIKSLGSITIGLPPMASRQAAGQQPLEDDGDVSAGRTEETLHAHLGWHTRYRFEVDVETEADGPASFLTGRRSSRREAFEWRYCSGAELRALEDDISVPAATDGGGDHVVAPGAPLRRASVKAGQLLRRALSRRSTGAVAVAQNKGPARYEKKGCTHPTKPRWDAGWQLVRLSESTDPLAEAIRAVKSSTRTTSTTTTPSRRSSIVSDLVLDQLIADEAGRAAARRRTSDGREIVALWATQREGDGGNDDDPSDVSPTQTVARFTFLGSGASGQLGERWALMAVMSGLAVWERARRARRRRRSTVVQACGGLASIGA